MNEVNSARESDDIDDSHGGSKEGNYENYQMQNLPQGYTGYREPRQVVETDYDRYEPDYAADETPQQDKKLRLETKRFRLAFKFTKSVIHESWSMTHGSYNFNIKS